MQGETAATPQDWEKALPDFRWKPTRLEFLANAIEEIDKEISDLMRKRVEYEGEFEELWKKQENKK